MAETNQLFGQRGEVSVEPAKHCALVTASDSADLTHATRGISFGTAGALKVTMFGGETVVIPSGALAAGVVHPLSVMRIWSTGTGASSIVAYW
jgi:hypothetical protein